MYVKSRTVSVSCFSCKTIIHNRVKPSVLPSNLGFPSIIYATVAISADVTFAAGHNLAHTSAAAIFACLLLDAVIISVDDSPVYNGLWQKYLLWKLLVHLFNGSFHQHITQGTTKAIVQLLDINTLLFCAGKGFLPRQLFVPRGIHAIEVVNLPFHR